MISRTFHILKRQFCMIYFYYIVRHSFQLHAIIDITLS